MFTNNTSVPAEDGKKHSLISVLLLGELLFLRFPFLIVADLILPRKSTIPLALRFFIFSVGTYLITAVLIWWEPERFLD